MPSDNSNENIAQIELELEDLFSGKGELPLSLIDLIFDIYAKDQTYFTDLIVDILAETKNLPATTLIKLIPSLTSIKKHKSSVIYYVKTCGATSYLA